MSALDEVRQAITTKLSTSGFTAAFPNVTIAFPNQPFETPDNQTYINVSIIHGDSQLAQISTDKSIDRHVGILQFDVVTPLDSGTKLSGDIADFLGKTYRRLAIATPSAGTLIFKTPTHLVVGQERGAYRLVVRIAFRRDEQFA